MPVSFSSVSSPESLLALDGLFDSLWRDYIEFNPRAKRIYDLIFERERSADAALERLVNDHVAFRTYDTARIGLAALSAIFQKYGYQEKGEYRFEEKRLYARHLQHPDERLPKVFISELETAKFSPLVQAVAEQVNASVSEKVSKQENLLWSGRHWSAEHSIYQKLLSESEYAAWMYAFGFRANHFTISVNHLKTFKDLPELNQFIVEAGYELNSAGGVIKGEPAQLLEQSSTLAERTRVGFADGVHEIPACYYEFARRYPLQEGGLYQGFIAASADKIFESTNARRT